MENIYTICYQYTSFGQSGTEEFFILNDLLSPEDSEYAELMRHLSMLIEQPDDDLITRLLSELRNKNPQKDVN